MSFMFIADMRFDNVIELIAHFDGNETEVLLYELVTPGQELNLDSHCERQCFLVREDPIVA
jgi:hypothetical protein